jgi:ABC-2 type transport system permease protein
MINISLALRDSETILRRDILRSLRNPTMTVSGLITPTVILVLFVYVFGNTMGSGLGVMTHSGSYLNYIAPAIIIMTVGTGCESTAINLCADMAEGIIMGFRPTASLANWIEALGIIALFTFAVSWMG